MRGRADLVAVGVAKLYGEEARERVQVPLAVDVLEVAALAAHDDRHVDLAVAAHAREVEPEVVARLLLEPDGGALFYEGHEKTLPPPPVSTTSRHA